MGYYFVRRLENETMEIMSVDDDDEDINNPKTWFWMIGSDTPVERSKIEIILGPFTVEQLHKKIMENTL